MAPAPLDTLDTLALYALQCGHSRGRSRCLLLRVRSGPRAAAVLAITALPPVLADAATKPLPRRSPSSLASVAPPPVLLAEAAAAALLGAQPELPLVLADAPVHALLRSLAFPTTLGLLLRCCRLLLRCCRLLCRRLLCRRRALFFARSPPLQPPSPPPSPPPLPPRPPPSPPPLSPPPPLSTSRLCRRLPVERLTEGRPDVSHAAGHSLSSFRTFPQRPDLYYYYMDMPLPRAVRCGTSLRKGSCIFGPILKASIWWASLYSRALLLSAQTIRRRSPGPPSPPDHRQAGERGAMKPCYERFMRAVASGVGLTAHVRQCPHASDR